MTLATAVILSYNRQDALRRQILYYASKPVHLIFADGSDNDWGSGESGAVGEMTWEYFRIPGFDSYLKRLEVASARVKTEYMFFLDDEECILWSGVKQAIEFLGVNLDHACAGGSANSTSLSWRRLCLVPHYSQQNNFSLILSDPIQRFNHLFSSKKTKACFYQVLRTSEVKVFAETVGDFSLYGKSRYVSEYLLHGYLALCGKYEAGKYPFWIRHGGSQPKVEGESETMCDQDVAEMAKLIFSAFRERNLRVDRNFGDISARDLEKCMCSLGDNGKRDFKNLGVKSCIGSGRGFMNRVVMLFLRFSTVIAHLVFDLYPPLYEAFRPHGLLSFKKFAIKNDPQKGELYKDILFLENIWVNHPGGVRISEFGSKTSVLTRTL